MANLLRLNHRSITFRLSFFFALGSLALLSILGIYLYTTLENRLDDEHNIFLAEDIDLMRATLAQIDGAIPLADDPHLRQLLTPTGSRLHIALFSAQMQPLINPSAIEIPTGLLLPAAPATQHGSDSVVWKSPDGRTYRMATAWADAGQARPQKVLLVLALDISIEQRLLQGYYDTLLITLLVAVICAASLGYVITRQGLKPVTRIARAANEITSSRLAKKLELDDAPAELRELAAAFNSMLDRLNESFSRLFQFSSDLAHELRTPINNLMGEAQVALSKARDAAEYRTVLESSVEEFERLSRMIKNMLFLARADRSDARIAAAWINAEDELKKIAEFYQLMADESGVRITCEGSAMVYADPLLFRRVVGNLLTNALHYSNHNSQIVMHTRKEPGGETLLSVQNVGPGIPVEHLERIFDRFYRIEPSREKSREGAGLGLAIVRTIMQLHGGTVGAASLPGGVTVFTLRFPPARA